MSENLIQKLIRKALTYEGIEIRGFNWKERREIIKKFKKERRRGLVSYYKTGWEEKENIKRAGTKRRLEFLFNGK